MSDVGEVLFALDVSNSHTTIGAFEGDELVDHWQVATDARRTADGTPFTDVTALLSTVDRAEHRP